MPPIAMVQAYPPARGAAQPTCVLQAWLPDTNTGTSKLISQLSWRECSLSKPAEHQLPPSQQRHGTAEHRQSSPKGQRQKGCGRAYPSSCSNNYPAAVRVLESLSRSLGPPWLLF